MHREGYDLVRYVLLEQLGGGLLIDLAAIRSLDSVPHWQHEHSAEERALMSRDLMDAAPLLAMFASGLLVAPLRRSGAGADMSRPVVAALAIYSLFLLWGILRGRRCGAD